MARMLSDFIHTAPAFRAAVNLQNELHDQGYEKAAAYLPTRAGAEVLFNVGRGLESSCRQRARLITGTYGTGKSHLALVLAALYAGRAKFLEPVLKRLAVKFPGRVEQWEKDLRLIAPDRPYLVVVVHGVQDSFDAALVRGLRKALDEAGLQDLMPQTYFTAAAARLRELSAETEAQQRLEEAVRAVGAGSAETLARRLEETDIHAVSLFDEVHRRVCFGTPYPTDQRVRAAETYRQTVADLLKAGHYSGIVVFWDEFGQFMERMMRDPAEMSGALQEFAEACNDSQDKPLHFYAISHRPLTDYVRKAESVALSTSEWIADFKKVAGRFVDFGMAPQSDELFQLLDMAIVQSEADGWGEYKLARDSELAILTDEVFRQVSFDENWRSRDLREIVVEGCHPMHPMAIALLPVVAASVAQNQRTLFQFLCAEDQEHTLAEFLRTTAAPGPNDPMPLMSADRLWPYFEEAIRADEERRGVYSHYRRAISRLPQSDEEETLAQRLLQAIALFELVVEEGGQQTRKTLGPTEERLALALDRRTAAEKEVLHRLLTELSGHGPNRVLRRDKDRCFRLVAGDEVDIEEEIKRSLGLQAPNLRPADFIRQRWGTAQRNADGRAFLELAEEMRLTYDRDRFPRTVRVIPILPRELENLTVWSRHLGGGDFWDGILFVVLPEEAAQIGVVRKATAQYADSVQLLFAVPNAPMQGLQQTIARLDALEAMVYQQPKVWGPEGSHRDEWEIEYEKEAERFARLVDFVGIRPDGQANGHYELTIHWQGEPYAVRNSSELEEVLGRAMAAAYEKTLPVIDDVMGPAGGKDGTTASRRAVMDALLRHDGPKLLANTSDKGLTRFVLLLQKLGLLREGPRPDIVREPPADRFPEMRHVCEFIRAKSDELRMYPDTALPLTDLVSILRASPYGIGARVQALVLAATLREDIMGGRLRLEQGTPGRGWRVLEPTGESIDVAFRDPVSYQLRYVEMPPESLVAVQGLIVALEPEAEMPAPTEILERTAEAAKKWWYPLPTYARTTDKLSAPARFLRDQILHPLVVGDEDPYEILMVRLVDKLEKHLDWEEEQWAETFGGFLREIEQSATTFGDEVCRRLLARWGCEDASPDRDQLRKVMREWYDALPEQTRRNRFGQRAGLLQAALTDSEGDVLEVLATTLTGKRVEDMTTEDAVVDLLAAAGEAKLFVDSWQPPATPQVGPSGDHIRIVINAQVPAGVEPFSRQCQLEPALVGDHELSSAAQMMLRFLITNFVQDRSLAPAERHTVLIKFLEEVLRDV